MLCLSALLIFLYGTQRFLLYSVAVTSCDFIGPFFGKYKAETAVGITVESMSNKNHTERVIRALRGVQLSLWIRMAICTVLLANIDEYAAFNAEYAKVFDGGSAPARAALVRATGTRTFRRSVSTLRSATASA